MYIYIYMRVSGIISIFFEEKIIVFRTPFKMIIYNNAKK